MSHVNESSANEASGPKEDSGTGSQRVFGPIWGIEVGRLFSNRADVSKTSVHRPTQAGISGAAIEGADSIVLNGEYVDDEDYGDVIIYTSHGGQDGSGRQVWDQELTRGNLSLKVSCDLGLPVRVTRGPRGDSKFSPDSGYRYDGLYCVVRYWPGKGKNGYRIWRYRLERIDQSAVMRRPDDSPAPRQTVISDRPIRNSTLAKSIRVMYNDTCQVCGQRVDSPTGAIAEAAHIKPLGRPDGGPDIEENMLCLCPNHHVQLDHGGIVIEDDLLIWELPAVRIIGPMTVKPGHALDVEFLAWRRDRWKTPM